MVTNWVPIVAKIREIIRISAYLAALPGLYLPGSAAAQAKIDYTAEIEPVLRASCYSCHSGDKPMAGLRLDTKAGALAKAIVPGDSAHSVLLERLLSSDPKRRMPMGGTPLAPEKVERLRAWIDQGAAWPDQAKTQKHWAYVKPSRPPVPAVHNGAWVRNPIDAFVLARLEKEGLTTSPEASREILLRRVSLDLTGLPPTPEEIDAFLADHSPGAYEKVVDRLLASPHYGERWARPWLDLARYADTNGFEADRRRTIWKYRDWVIDAFNRDMPFDRFTIEQIAGDMLPKATEEQRIATGFHRNTMFNEEGGVDQMESHWDTLIDRANTTATVWLGSTLGCAQCHDHKYDPFTQKEYYQFLAFFNNSDAQPRTWADRNQTMVEPRLEMPSAEQEKKRNGTRGRDQGTRAEDEDADRRSWRARSRTGRSRSPRQAPAGGPWSPSGWRPRAASHSLPGRTDRCWFRARIRAARLTKSRPKRMWPESRGSGWRRSPTRAFREKVRAATFTATSS